MTHFKDERSYPFLQPLKQEYLSLKQDFLDIFRFIGRENLTVMSTASRAVRSRKADWKAFAFVVHGKAPHEHMKERNFLLPGMKPEGFAVLVRAAEQIFFRRTRRLLKELLSEPANGIVSMWFSYFEPGARLGLHVNNDPYMYRAHLGLIVPPGEVAFKVRDEVTAWREGEIFVFDPTLPHTAWNLTPKPRVVFIVDFLRPDRDRPQMRELEREQFERMMRLNPLSFGMSGGQYDLDAETVARYAVPGIG
jgi:aspartyl/asparaginyl beta-hydroxylase (cupin superfamily)